jgi:hypothetical protein
MEPVPKEKDLHRGENLGTAQKVHRMHQFLNWEKVWENAENPVVAKGIKNVCKAVINKNITQKKEGKMPGLNQKGPQGLGAMSGRKMGKCTNFGTKNTNESSGKQSSKEIPPRNGMGRGLRRGQGGCGMRMGRRNHQQNN